MHKQYNGLCIIGGDGKLTDDNANNGLISKIWGPGLWIGMHSITFGYPVKPSDEQKQKYRQFFTLIGDVLPCRYCRESYTSFITEGNVKITDKVFENRDSITKWLYDLHEEVNKKLGVDYRITYDDVVSKYESFRAKCKKDAEIKGCVMPLDAKSQCYKIAYYKEYPIISFDIAKQFINYAEKRNISKEDLEFFYTYKDNEKLRKSNANINCELWSNRNKDTDIIVKKMRINSIPSIETTGKWKGLPTVDELQLIIRLTSNLSNKKLKEIANTLSNNLKKKYILKKVT